MPNLPPEIFTKLKRANSKFVLLKDSISKFVLLKDSISKWRNENTLTLTLEFRPKRHGINLKCNMKDVSVPIENWRLDLGEMIYTLRSALDNMIFFCAEQHLNPPAKPRSLYFPIFSDAIQFNKVAKNTISQLDSDISELVEKIQPYHRKKTDADGTPETDPLVSLKFLSNLDKHRMAVPFLVPPHEISINHCFKFHTEADATANAPPNVVLHTNPLEHGKRFWNLSRIVQ